MEYLISDAKVAKIRDYRSQRVWNLMKEHDLDFLYLWDYGNTRYAFDIMTRFHPESDNALTRLCTFRSNNKQYQPDGQKETVVFSLCLLLRWILKK